MPTPSLTPVLLRSGARSASWSFATTESADADILFSALADTLDDHAESLRALLDATYDDAEAVRLALGREGATLSGMYPDNSGMAVSIKVDRFTFKATGAFAEGIFRIALAHTAAE